MQLKKYLFHFKEFLIQIFIGNKNHKRKKELRKIKYWHHYLSENYGYIADKYKKAEKPITHANIEYKIWVMWWQGEENMPEIIRINFDSLKRNSNGHEIVLITKDNCFDYLKIPNYIIDKVSRNIISLTHLSDYIRVALLSKHGGLWLDATVYVNSPLPIEFNLPYWTNKWELRESEYDSYNLWIGLWGLSSVPKLLITQYMGIWYSFPNNPLFVCLNDFWLAYWKKENHVPYYWTTELFLIGIMFDKIESVKEMINNIQFNNPQTFNMRYYMNKKFDKHVWNELLSDTQFFYLSWKEKYLEIDPETNEKTLFKYLKD